MLEVIDIEKNYPLTKALDGISFTVASGQIMALLARNGAGKSTLISIIVGLLAADKGQVLINGEQRKGKHLSRANQQIIGFAGQDTGIYPELTLAENLYFFGRLQNVSRRQLKSRINDVSCLLGLQDLLKRPANQLSGGEKRRLHTAAALLHQPKLLLLDEPTVGADVEARQAILDSVKLLADNGTAIVYTSHYFPEIETLGADITVMEQGRLVDQGSQQTLLQRYGQHTVKLQFNQAVADKVAQKLGCPQGKDPYRLDFLVEHSVGFLPRLLESLGELANHILHIEQQHANLEQIFLTMTQPKNSPC